jgi:hypothetical protein
MSGLERTLYIPIYNAEKKLIEFLKELNNRLFSKSINTCFPTFLRHLKLS